MSNVIQCDKCKVYVPYGRDSSGTMPYLPQPGEKLAFSRVKLNGEFGVVIDLCEKCYKGLLDWLGMKKL